MWIIQSCPTLWDPTDCSPPGSSVHGILQARIPEWVAMPSSRGSSQPRDQTQVSCIAGGFFTAESPGKPVQKPRTLLISELHLPRDPASIQLIWSKEIYRFDNATQESPRSEFGTPPRAINCLWFLETFLEEPKYKQGNEKNPGLWTSLLPQKKSQKILPPSTLLST